MIKLNGHLIEPTRFPDGTTQAWKLPEEVLGRRRGMLDWRFEREEELLTIGQLAYLMAAYYSAPDRVLRVPYLPFARQDKDVNNFKTFALHPFIAMLNTCIFGKVVTWDLHNPRVLGGLYGHVNVDPTTVHAQLIKDLDIKTIIFPDQGAALRYPWLMERKDLAKAVFAKKRDQVTGKIDGFEILDSSTFATKGRALIVDDICDGGATFLGIEKELRERGIRESMELHLFVTHGLWSKGKEILTEAGITLWTTNSLPRNPEGIPLPDGYGD